MMFDQAAKNYVSALILNLSNGKVMSGPFQGMQLTPEVSWPDGNNGTKALGCYEQELHKFIEEEIELLRYMPHPTIVDIGCSEGYYAVGLARRLPKATVWAFDISKDALRITEHAAVLNEVKVVVDGRLAAAMEFPDLVISDCEGAELDYLDPAKFPGLENSSIIVECHDFGKPVTDELKQRFALTHHIEQVLEGARDPNQFEFLRGLPSIIRWLAVSEGRPCMMWWLLMRPRPIP
jgi:SAM-dependent methyltransferase